MQLIITVFDRLEQRNRITAVHILACFPFYLMQSSLISSYHQPSVHTTTLQISIMDTARGIMNLVDQAVQDYNNPENRNTLTNLGGTSFDL
jgi:hypothetical protein